MTWEDMKKVSAQELNSRRAALTTHIGIVEANYMAAARREAAAEIEEVKLIDHEFRIRSWADDRK